MPKPQSDSDDNYKREYEQSKFIAIPYNNGTPMPKSRFASAIESLNYTIQKELFGDNFVTYVSLEIEKLKKTSNNFDYLYKKLVGEDLSNKNIFKIDSKDIKSIVENLNLDKKIGLINDHALSQIRLYEMQIQTNAQIYEFLFHTVQGFSGTLWNYQTFPQKFLSPVLSETSEITKNILLNSDPKIKILEEQNLEGLVNQIYDNWQSPGSFIDEAGIFRAFNNQEVAKAIMQKLKDDNSISGIIFYDDLNNLLIMDKEYKVENLSQTKIPIDKRIAFWDKQHTTGSDLKLKANMTAKMSFDRHLKSRDLEQSVWRLRGLDKEQKIIEVVSFSKDVKIIENKLNKNISTFEDILNYSDINQKEQLDFISWRSFTQGLKNKLVKVSFENLFAESKLDINKYVDYLQELVVSKNDQKPYEIYGLPVGLLDKNNAVDLELNNIKNKKSYNKELDSEISNFIEYKKANLPEKIMVSNVEQGQEVEVELNTQTQAQVQTQVQAEQLDPSKPAPKDIVYDWSLNDDVFKNNFYENFKDIIYTTKQALEKDPQLAALFESMNDTIYLSKNFAPLDDENFAFFDQYAKALTNVLVVFDSNENKYSLVLLDLNDVKEWKSFLLTHKYNQKDPLKIALYDLELNSSTVGDNLDVSNELLVLIVQAKFFAGVLEYSLEEQAILKNWISQSHKLKELKNIFKNIVSYKNETLKNYKNSILFEIFE